MSTSTGPSKFGGISGHLFMPNTFIMLVNNPELSGAASKLVMYFLPFGRRATILTGCVCSTLGASLPELLLMLLFKLFNLLLDNISTSLLTTILTLEVSELFLISPDSLLLLVLNVSLTTKGWLVEVKLTAYSAEESLCSVDALLCVLCENGEFVCVRFGHWNWELRITNHAYIKHFGERLQVFLRVGIYDTMIYLLQEKYFWKRLNGYFDILLFYEFC